MSGRGGDAAGGGPVGEWGGGDRPPPGLPVERTGLAWARTGLTVCAVALALSRVAGLEDRPGPAVLALVAATVGLAAFLVGGLRGAGRRGRPEAAPPTLPRTASYLVVAVLTIAAAGLWLLAGR